MSLKYVTLFLKPLIAIMLLGGMSASSFAAKGSADIERRLGRLENLMSSQVLMEQSQRLEQIQQELSSLRGLLEAQEHQLGLIKQRQRNLYQDMDRRLNDLEIQGGSAGTASAGASSNAIPPPESGTEGSVSSGGSPVPPPGSTTGASAGVAAMGTGGIVGGIVEGDKNGKAAYSTAFNTLKEGKYPQAIKLFKAFLQNYPDSIYRANAQYWLGEAYSVSREYKTALKAFQKVISEYPESTKVEGSMLKIGFTYYEMKNWASARTSLDSVIRKFPGTTVSRKAKERLQRMKREGRY